MKLSALFLGLILTGPLLSRADDRKAAEILRAGMNPPGGITGITETTLKKEETVGSIKLPKGTRIKTLADGTLVSVKLGAATDLIGRKFPKNATIQFDARLGVLTAQFSGPTKFDGMDFKSPAKLYFRGSNLWAIEFSKPQWVKGYPAEKRVEFHSNTMLAGLTLSEDFKIAGKIFKKGFPLEFTLEGQPITPETTEFAKKCNEARSKLEAWLESNVPMSCTKDDECMIQELLPFPCSKQRVVAKPGLPDSKHAELKSFWDTIIEACKVPKKDSVTCEAYRITPKCVNGRCTNGF